MLKADRLKLVRGVLFARVAMRTAMAQTDKSICLFAMRFLCVETSSNPAAELKAALPLCSVSLVEVRSDKTQTLKGLLSNPHDFSSQRKTLMVFLCKSLKDIGV